MQAMVVSQDLDEREMLALILRRAGLAVASGANLERVMGTWSDHPADLIVLALSEGQTPVKAVQIVRHQVSAAHLLMIVDPVAEKEFCAMLQEGADLVLPRPVSSQVLAAYTAAMMRRVGTLPAFVLPTLALDKIVLDPATRTVALEDQEARRLTQLEFNLLYVLMTNRGHVVPLEVIVERVWGFSGEGSKELVRGLVSRLRHKIEPEGATMKFLETIPGVGYRFIAEDP